MKTKYIDLMEKILSAYTPEHIVDYFERVKKEGLTEHGFPRLTANIGILISYGKRTELFDLFKEMMEFCCKTIPNVKAANDFSVREVVCCIEELERSGVAEAADIARWKSYLATIDPQTCYDQYTGNPAALMGNWTLFVAVSEFYRCKMGLGDTYEIIDIQLATQMRLLDENGMYKDNIHDPEDLHHPLVYDLVPRGLFSMLLHAGYRGKFYKQIDECLKKAGLHTLEMQSVTGELAFGGRSNQFLHNEAWEAAIFEYEAIRYHQEGNFALAGKFKAAAKRTVENTEYWLNQKPISHIKNRYPFAVHHGCEGYAYFDKYMITAASFYYAAFRFCDDSIETAAFDDSPIVWSTSEHFHKVFARAGGYSVEFDTNADPHYDAKGLGRVHKYGAPSAICMSLPCPEHPNYKVKEGKPMSASLCPGIKKDGEWNFATNGEWVHEMTGNETGEEYASVAMDCRLNDETLSTQYRVDKNGVSIAVKGNGEIGYMLPAYAFDGKNEPEIAAEENSLTITYEGWQCRYTTNGKIMDSGKTAPNRNGHYRIFHAISENTLDIKIEIVKK